jgi:Tfp pilus assembly protein PilX
MKNNMINSLRNESGVALVTSLMITVLLGIACIAMLSSVGANSMNSTDVLSETKAYYAAESGLQATINVLRNDNSVDYKYAVSNPTLAGKLPYNYPTSGTANRAVVGEPANTYNPRVGTAYSVVVSDPDNSATSLTFNTSGIFLSYSITNGATVSTDQKTIYIPSATASPRTEITFTNAPSTTHNFTGNPFLGQFDMTNVGGGVVLTGEIKFRIDYNMTAPRPAVRSIFGSIKQASATDPKLLTFQTQNYELLESKIKLCNSLTAAMPCADVLFNLTATPTNNKLYANITAVEPYRLKVVSTGYGPNGAIKQLEGIIQKNFFNGLASGAATTLIGPTTGFRFEPGKSSGITYSGGNCASSVGCVPSFGLTNPTNLAYVTSNPPGPGSGNPAQMTPPPALLDSNNIPDWQQTPAALDALVNQLRQTAMNSGRYFKNPSGDASNFDVGSVPNPPGDKVNGTGITFCDGSCKIGADGGGILVVTGKLTNVGGFSFKGIIIVTGEEGWERSGAGNGQVIGNVIIAPYNRIPYVAPNLSSTFLPPQYYVTGGGTSDVIYDNLGSTLNNTSAISDFMLGIAEK